MPAVRTSGARGLTDVSVERGGMDPQRDGPTVEVTETRVRSVIDVDFEELVAVSVGLVAHAVSSGGGGGDEDPT